MIKRKEKFETPNFIFWLTEYEQTDMVEYDIIFGSKRVSPPATKEDLVKLSEFIANFVKSDVDK
jgi:hypothetical protein